VDFWTGISGLNNYTIARSRLFSHHWSRNFLPSPNFCPIIGNTKQSPLPDATIESASSQQCQRLLVKFSEHLESSLGTKNLTAWSCQSLPNSKHQIQRSPLLGKCRDLRARFRSHCRAFFSPVITAAPQITTFYRRMRLPPCWSMKYLHLGQLCHQPGIWNHLCSIQLPLQLISQPAVWKANEADMWMLTHTYVAL
jgi:hypothetical protein